MGLLHVAFTGGFYMWLLHVAFTTTNSDAKNKFESLNKVMLIDFWGMKANVIVDFLEKDATVISASYCRLFRQNSPLLLNNPHINNDAYHVNSENSLTHSLAS